MLNEYNGFCDYLMEEYEILMKGSEEFSNNTAGLKSEVVLYIISGGVGSSGEQLARTIAAQFPDVEIQIVIFQKVFTSEKLLKILNDARENSAIVMHTFVDPDLRKVVIKTSEELGITQVDLVGQIMENLTNLTKQKPLGEPGLYRQLYRSYFDRIEAIDFGFTHDDGKNPEGWAKAEIILLGVSRVGKTPISLYLSVLGWKVANVPFIAGIEPKEDLFKVDKHRLVGLTISPSDLLNHRRHRQRSLGVSGLASDYIDPVKVYEEIDSVERKFRRNGISIIDVTGKSIETSADEIIQLMRRKIKNSK